MTRLQPRWIAATLMALAASAMGASSPDAAHIAANGNGRGARACASCHGVDGGGQAAAGFPRLAGLDAAYVERQLHLMGSGGTPAAPQ